MEDIFETNGRNPKWNKENVPNLEQTQDWMMEEEFVTDVLAEVMNVPCYIVARKHNVANLSNLFFSGKKRVYLSYPITAVRASNPDLLDRVQGPILETLEELFVVFNPLAIKDMPLTYDGVEEKLPELVEHLTPRVKETIKKRTVVRDYRFIDQSDAVVVFYLTDKLSPGVLAEIYYAHRTQTPVFMVYAGSKSPFMEDATTYIESDIDALMKRLKEFADS